MTRNTVPATVAHRLYGSHGLSAVGGRLVAHAVIRPSFSLGPVSTVPWTDMSTKRPAYETLHVSLGPCRHHQ